MGTTRALGALLCIGTVLVAVLHIWFGYISEPNKWAIGALSFALPITVGVLAVCVLGFWLGWIMATTREVTPPAPKAEESKSEK
ncbi:MAG TPA: hypothetical protein EYP46_00470 [Hadesarchaea archaeon]|nr:hypothetical protein [Hadesarchaea archaeon]